MFDIAPTELLLCAVVALVVIGPKDLPRAMRTVGQFVAKVRGVGRHFRSSFDEMVREAELKEMEEAWAKENARIMREHPPEEAHDATFAQADPVALPAPEPDSERARQESRFSGRSVPTDAAASGKADAAPGKADDAIEGGDAESPAPVARPHIHETERP